MPHITMWAYPWDLLDEGPLAVARRLADEVGLDAVSVATAYHTYDQIRPHLGGRLIRADRAHAYFTPRPQHYKDTPLQPDPRWPDSERDPMAEIAEALDAAGLGFISWTVTLHNSALGEAHPRVLPAQCAGRPLHLRALPGQPGGASVSPGPHSRPGRELPPRPPRARIGPLPQLLAPPLPRKGRRRAGATGAVSVRPVLL